MTRWIELDILLCYHKSSYVVFFSYPVWQDVMVILVADMFVRKFTQGQSPFF